jgi:uncharacterized phage-associated protein
MASAHDVAAYILSKQSAPISTWKLQKLVYYAQAWHLAWDEEPLFSEAIEAWANGPVVRELYGVHRGSFSASEWSKGNAENLTPSERDTIDLVLENYGELSGRQLSVLTHNESPWQDARAGLPATARSQRRITPEALHEFYSALDADQNASAVGELDWKDWEDIDY